MMMNSNIMNHSKTKKRSIGKLYSISADESTSWKIRMKLTEHIKDAARFRGSDL